MIINIEPDNQTPIYIQLLYGIKEGIVKEQLKPGELLPSVRSLASDIGINLHTVNKAYKQLEEEGILERTTKGFQVCEKDDVVMQDNYLITFEEKYRELLIDAAVFNVKQSEIDELKKKISDKLCKEED